MYFDPDQLPDAADVTADTETSGLFVDDGHAISIVSVAYTDPASEEVVAHAWPFAQDPFDSGFDKNCGEDVWTSLLAWLNTRSRLVFHQAIFDLPMLRHGVGIPGELWLPGIDLHERNVWDTMLVQRHLDPDHLSGLEEVEQRIFGTTRKRDSKSVMRDNLFRKKGAKVSEFWKADLDVILPYSTIDAEITHKLYLDQIRRLEEGEGSWGHIQEHHKQLKTLVRMERRGVGYDTEEAFRVGELLAKRIAEKDNELPFRPTGPAAAEYFFGPKESGGLGLKPIKMTRGGAKSGPKPAIDNKVVTQLVLDGVPYADLWQERTLLAGKRALYYQGWPEKTGKDGRMRSRMRQLGTATGRMSSSRINMQAIPHDRRFLVGGGEVFKDLPTPRRLVRPRPGFVLWEPDLSQAELRIGAMLARCPNMIEPFLHNVDLHGVTTTAVFGFDPLEMPEKFKQHRPMGKEMNLSLLYGVGAKRLRVAILENTGVVLTESKAYSLRKAWYRQYPEIDGAIRAHSRLAEHYGYTEIAPGYRRYYEPNESLHKAWNTKVQGLLALMSKEWMQRVDEYLYHHPLLQGLEYAGLLMQVHDSLLFELPEEGGEELANEVVTIGLRVWKKWFPDIPGNIDLKKWGSD